MKRPFYVHTPRNVYGEHITRLPYSIRSVYERYTEIKRVGLDWKKAEEICKEMNDKYEAEMAAIYI